jgi:error-prone DNA polymerase
VRSKDLLTCRSRSEILVAGVKVATQTPPIRSGRRVVFVTLDDATGPVDATFFEDAQGPYAATLFHSWLLVIRGEVRRTGPRGISLRATGCWELTGLYDLWQQNGIQAVLDLIDTPPPGFGADEVSAPAPMAREDQPSGYTAGGMGRRRVLVHPSGFKQSPYADVKPAGGDVNRGTPPRKLWHSSPGSSGG